MSSFRWTDWSNATAFRIRIAEAAVEKLEQLAPDTQDRLRGMMRDIAELADLTPGPESQGWTADARPLLHLQMGRVTVRYSINEEDRTLTVEHVIVPEMLSDVG